MRPGPGSYVKAIQSKSKDYALQKKLDSRLKSHVSAGIIEKIKFATNKTTQIVSIAKPNRTVNLKSS